MDIRIVSLQGNHEEQGSSLTIETVTGQIQVLEEHADMIATIEEGQLVIEGGNEKYFVGSGLMRIEEGNCTLMLDRLAIDNADGRETAQDRLVELRDREDHVHDDSSTQEIEFLEHFLAN